jgi:cobalt-zinc-cadmium resistance protein CzcA
MLKKEIVTGGVYKLHGANSFEVIARLKERIKEVNEILPPGVKIITYYDQSSLVRNSINTVRGALTSGFILVALVVFAFLGKFRNALIVVFSLPFSMLLTFTLMRHYGIPGDLISFGGVAIALGMIVDATIVMVERIQSSFQKNSTPGSVTQIILSAAKEVGPPIFFLLLLSLLFLYLFLLLEVWKEKCLDRLLLR